VRCLAKDSPKPNATQPNATMTKRQTSGHKGCKADQPHRTLAAQRAVSITALVQTRLGLMVNDSVCSSTKIRLGSENNL
jgi:hypothetical protein